jgi:hypothetical protein
MKNKQLTYRQLHCLLIELDFVTVPTTRPWKAYRHPSSETLILLAGRKADDPARGFELLSIRRHLVENGIVNEEDLDPRLAEAA